jgi:long-chain fatty acid transport protein
MHRLLMVIIIGLFPVVLAYGAGFGLGEFGGRAIGMGNAVAAQAYDASTLFYNPAGLAFLEGTNFYGGVTIIDPAANFVGAKPYFVDTVYDAKKQIFPPVGIYISHRFSEKIAAGISLTTPFGLGLAWGDDFPGDAISKDATLESYYITPVVSYQLMPELSVAIGPDLVITRLELKRTALLFNTAPGTGTEVGQVDLKGTSDLGVGFIAGIMYQKDRLGLGFMYRHSIKNKVDDGDAKFTFLNNLDPKTLAIAQGILIDQKVSTEIDFPNYFVAGIHYMILEKLGAEIDFAWYGWDVFKEISLKFKDERLNQTIPENYENSIQLRFGAHYELTEQFSVRAGYIYDKTPQPIESVSPLLPDDTRNDYTIGLGYKNGNFRVDGGYMFVDIGERSTVEDGVGKNDNGFNGTYNSNANLYFLSVGYTIK